MNNEMVDLGNVERIIRLVSDVAQAENINLLEVMEACTAIRAACVGIIDRNYKEITGKDFKVTESNTSEPE